MKGQAVVIIVVAGILKTLAQDFILMSYYE